MYNTKEELREAAECAAYQAVPIIITNGDQHEWDKAYVDFLINIYFER